MPDQENTETTAADTTPTPTHVPKRYPLNPKLDLEDRFTYHAPRPDQLPRYEEIRRAALEFARLLERLTPPSREQSTALTHLDAVVMFSNAAIARNEQVEQQTN